MIHDLKMSNEQGRFTAASLGKTIKITIFLYFKNS